MNGKNTYYISQFRRENLCFDVLYTPWAPPGGTREIKEVRVQTLIDNLVNEWPGQRGWGNNDKWTSDILNMKLSRKKNMQKMNG